MTQKKPFYYVTVVVTSLLVIAGVVCNIQFAVSLELPFLFRVAAVFTIVAMIFALEYVLLGCKKNAAKSLRNFMASYALSQFATVICSVELSEYPPVAVGMAVVIFGLLIVLTVGENLGRTRSLVITGIILLIHLFSMIAGFVNPEDLGDSLGLFAASKVALGVMLLLMIIAKYIDKVSRGRAV